MPREVCRPSCSLAGDPGAHEDFTDSDAPEPCNHVCTDTELETSDFSDEDSQVRDI